jgi:hypothetical protein
MYDPNELAGYRDKLEFSELLHKISVEDEMLVKQL